MAGSFDKMSFAGNSRHSTDQGWTLASRSNLISPTFDALNSRNAAATSVRVDRSLVYQKVRSPPLRQRHSKWHRLHHILAIVVSQPCCEE